MTTRFKEGASTTTMHRPELIQPLALRRESAATALGVSVEYFDRYIRPEIRTVRRGRLELYPVEELRRWLDDNSDDALAA